MTKPPIDKDALKNTGVEGEDVEELKEGMDNPNHADELIDDEDEILQAVLKESMQTH